MVGLCRKQGDRETREAQRERKPLSCLQFAFRKITSLAVCLHPHPAAATNSITDDVFGILGQRKWHSFESVLISGAVWSVKMMESQDHLEPKDRQRMWNLNVQRGLGGVDQRTGRMEGMGEKLPIPECPSWLSMACES